MRLFSRLAPLAAAFLLTATAIGCVDLAGARYVLADEKRFTVTDTPQVTVSTFDGRIDVEGWDRSEVVVRVETRAFSEQAAKDVDVVAEQRGNQITVDVKRLRPRVLHVGWDASARLIVSLPRKSNVTATSRDGRITVAAVSGTIELRSNDGSISGNDLSGGIRIHTNDGSIRLNAVDGDIDADTNDGSIIVDGKLSGVRVRTNDGRVRV